MVGPATRRGTWWRALQPVADRHLGLVTSAQLDRIGVSRQAQWRAAEAGALTRVRKGVYALPGTPKTWPAAVMAAVLAGGPDAVASHWTAARLWRLFDGPIPPQAEGDTPIHVTTLRHRRLTGVVSHRRRVAPAEAAIRSCIPVTSVARTLADLASVMEADALGRATDEALRRRILLLADLRRVYDQHAGAGRRRLRPLHAVLAARDPGFDPGANEWEQRMDRLWARLGLPAAERQYWIRAGGQRYRVDRAIPPLRLAVEWVGSEYHAQTGRYRRDRLRISDLALAGWEVLEVTPGWAPERIRRTVMGKVAERQLLLEARAGALPDGHQA